MGRLLRLLGTLALLVMVLSVTTGPSSAAPSGSIPGLDKPGDQLTDTDLIKFVDLALGHQIISAQVRDFYSRLSEKQIEKIGHILDDRASKVTRTRGKGYRPVPSASSGGVTTMDEYPVYWANYIYPAFIWPWDGTFADWYYETTTACSQTGDTDYVFYFTHSSANQNALRWSENDAALETVLFSYRADGSN